MADAKTTATTETKPQPKAGRSPSYPAVNLEEALRLAQTLHDRNGKHSAPVVTAITYWGHTSATGPALRKVAALKKYGLVTEEGANEAREIKLTDLALDIVLHPRADDPERIAKVQQAALSPGIFAELWEECKAGMKDDDVLKYDLIRKKSFTQAAADEVVNLFKATIQFAGLVSGGTIARQEEAKDPTKQPRETDKKVVATPQKPKMDTALHPLDLTIPIGVGRTALLTVPQPLSKSEFDMLKKSLDLWGPVLTKNGNADEAEEDEQ